ncbi:MAG: hypothetical protein WBK53_04975, partial [Halanaerobiales bacterium]
MAQNKNRIEIPQDRNSYLGTLNRTWIDKVNKKVGRYFPEEKYEQIVYIHKLSRELAANDIPVQRPLCEPVPVNNLIVAYYQYCKNDPGDFKDGWYVPEETPERIANAAKTFAEFQKLAKDLRGPEKPLDYPYCNSLDWILEPSPLEMWGRDWDSKKFALDYDKFNHFLDVYIQHGGPVKLLESLV